MTVRDIVLAAAGVGGSTPPPASTDPQFNYVSLLLNDTGTNGQQNNTFVSEPVVVPSGIGYLAGQFSGSGQYVSTPNAASLQLGAGDFTVEAWIFAPKVTNTYASSICGTYGYVSSVDRGWLFLLNSTGYLAFNMFGSSGAGFILTSSTITQANQWLHVAAVRSGTTVTLYLNGVSVATGSSSKNEDYSVVDFNIATCRSDNLSPATGNAGLSFSGYISNLRVVKGTAVYTSAFTPPTSPLTAISGTSLLTCQSGSGSTFADNSTNNFTITVTGTPKMTGVATSPPGVLPYAGSFNGSSQYLTLANNSAFDFGTGDFTIEAWVYLNSLASVGTFFSAFPASGTISGYSFSIDTTGAISLDTWVSGTEQYVLASNNKLSANAWYHIAYTRNSGTSRLFVNGVSCTFTGAISQAINSGGNTLKIGYQGYAGYPYYVNGYISNLRAVKGTAVYTSNFAPPASPLTNITNTSLLTLQSSTFVDNSSNAFTITNNGSTPVVSSQILPAITRNGTPTQGSVTPYWPDGQWSNYFSNAPYLSAPYTAPTQFGSGDFTVEAWMYLTDISKSNYLFAQQNSSVNTNADLSVFGAGITNGGFYFGWCSGSSQYNATAPTGSMKVNTWHHVACVRYGNAFTVYIDGVAKATTTSAVTVNTIASTPRNGIGGYTSPFGNEFCSGYISNLRMVKGTAVYTSAFTPSTTPLTAISGTSLLTCQSNRFKDNSSNNFAITVTGTPSAQAFEPFEPTASYSAATYGGSGYFPGSSYLTYPAGVGSAFGTGDFTVEMWFYTPSSSTTNYYLLDNRNSGQTTNWAVLHEGTSSNKLQWFTGATSIVSSTSPTSNQWNHFAYTRSGTTGRLFLNGTQIATGTDSTNYSVSSTISYIASRYTAVEQLNGYISNLRIVKGTAVYTTAFTPPTAPVTAITGTSLLLNATNAGIYDAAVLNDLTTVGDAKVSTAQAKWGGSSMAFDGTGDYLTSPNSQNFNFGTGDFTVETWVYTTTTASGSGTTTASQYIIDARTASTTSAFILGFRLLGSGTGNLLCWYTGSTVLQSSAVSINQWHHVAYTRSGTTGRLFLDGVQVATQTDSTNYVSGATITYGSRYTVENFLFGYIEDLRVTKGYARYTSNFTPPTAAFPTR